MKFSSYALIFANLIPLFGVVFYAWDAKLVLALFWIENLIIGAFNLLRMGLAGVVQKNSSAFFLTLFFILHYGLFCSVHGQLLSDLLNYPDVDYREYFSETQLPFMPLLLDGAAVLLRFITEFAPQIYFGIAALVLSRAVSFIEHFILKGDVFNVRLGKLMGQPYSQIIVMHAGLIIGAMALENFGSSNWLLGVIVLLKIATDFYQHQKRHIRQIED